MSVFLRRFTTDPGQEVFLEIEAVNILDLEPPGAIAGVGTGTALLVAEFEDGPFEEVTEVTSSTDMAKQFGGFGYVYAGSAANNPCARSRKSDGAIVPEYWNGNGLVALNGKKFRRLLLCRVDTSVGEVQFSRLAWLAGNSLFSYALAAGDTLTFDVGGATLTATFSAAAAAYASAAGTYPSTFVGGETLTLKRDGQPNVVVVFQAADQTQAQVIARINEAMGYTAAVDSGAGVTTLSGLVQGLAGSIAVIAASALVLTATGFAVGSAAGTGNVQNIAQVTPEEIDTRVSAASSADVRVRQLDDGTLRMENVADALTGVLRVTGGAAMTKLGFSASQNTAWQDVPTPVEVVGVSGALVTTATGFSAAAGVAVQLSAAGTYPSTFVGGEYLQLQVEGQPLKTVVFTSADQTQAQVIARINLVMGYEAAKAVSATVIALAGPGTNNTSIPAGTRVRNVGGVEWVTMQSQTVQADDPGPVAVKVRPALDDGTVAGATAGTVTVMGSPVQGSAFAVVNPLALSAALSESAIDAAYLEAIAATINSNTVAAEANLIWSARASNAVRGALKQNVLDAASGGLLGRMCAVRPPLGTTTRAMARSSAAQPGVGAYRDQRLVYNFPGVQTFMPAIAAKGLAGGAGFTADGIIDTGSDGFLISTCSQLAPEENPGQLTAFTGGALGVERNNPDVQNLTITDYTNFRASGICAPRMDGGIMVFQSGVTSVDPSVQPSLRNIARRRMADFIQDTLGRRLKNFGKKLNTRNRRASIIAEIRAFMNGLLSPGNPAAQRIDGFKLDPSSGNTPDTLALGIFRIILNVRTLSSLDAIVLQTTIGEGVDVAEAALAPGAAGDEHGRQ